MSLSFADFDRAFQRGLVAGMGDRRRHRRQALRTCDETLELVVDPSVGCNLRVRH